MAAVKNLTVEIVGADGGLYPCTVLDVALDTIYLKTEEDWMPEGAYSIGQLGGRLFEPPSQHTPEEMRNQLTVSGPVEVFYRIKQGAPAAWYRGKLMSQTKELYSVDLAFTPVRRVIQPIEHVRIPKDPVPLSLESITKCAFTVPPDAINEATTEQQLHMYAQHAKLDYVRYDPGLQAIVVLAYGAAALYRAHILCEVHIRYAQIRQGCRTEIATTRAKLNNPQVLESGAPTFCCEFVVPRKHFGLSIGWPRYINVQNAKNIPGIVQILVNPETGLFTVVAETEAAMKEARDSLEYVTEVIYVDQNLVGRIIGNQGRNIQEILRSTNVRNVDICDSRERAEQVGVVEWRDGFVPMVVVGLRNDAEAVKMLVQYQVDHHRQMDVEMGARRREAPQRREQFSRQETEESIPQNGPQRQQQDSNNNNDQQRPVDCRRKFDADQRTGRGDENRRANTAGAGSQQQQQPTNNNNNNNNNSNNKNNNDWPVLGDDRRNSNPNANKNNGQNDKFQDQNDRRNSNQRLTNGDGHTQQNYQGNERGRGRGRGNYGGRGGYDSRRSNGEKADNNPTNNNSTLTNGDAHPPAQKSVDTDGDVTDFQPVGRKRGGAARGRGQNGPRGVAVESQENERVSR